MLNASNIQFSTAVKVADQDRRSNSPEPGLSSQGTLQFPKKFVNSLSSMSKKELEKRDIYGRTLLHTVCLVNKRYLLDKLLKNPNLNIAITDLENHWNCLHYAIFYKNFIIAQMLISKCHLLLQGKDREGFTPLDLMSSEIDIWRLKWIPESVGRLERPRKKKQIEARKYGVDEINLQKRFSEDQSVFQAIRTPKWFDINRGGSNLVMTGSVKEVSHGPDHLVNVDMRKLKHKYADTETYPKLSERISYSRIRDVKMSRNHTIVLTSEPRANMFVSGLGTRGRLGSGNGQPQDSFAGVPAFEHERVLFVDVSNDHSICVTADAKVYTWGLNSYGQLGYQVDIAPHQTEACVSTPRVVNTGDLRKYTQNSFLGASCSKFHSLVYTKSEIFVWGLNIGQFGFNPSGSSAKIPGKDGMGLVQTTPCRTLFSYGNIRTVFATDTFTLVLSDLDELHFYLKGFHSKVCPPLLKKIDSKAFNSFQPRVLSQKKSIHKVIVQKGCDVCLLLLDNGDILQLSMDSRSIDNAAFQRSLKFTTVWKASKEHLRCTDVDMSNDGSVIICVQDGSAYKRIKRTILKDSISSHEYISRKFKFSKISGLNKVVKVVSDPLFSKFAFVRDDIDLIPHRLSKSSILSDFSRLSPLHEIQDDLQVQRQTITNRENEVFMTHDDSYQTDFIYKIEHQTADDDEALWLEETEMPSSTSDNLDKVLHDRWTQPYKAVPALAALPQDESLREMLKSEELDYWIAMKDLSRNKHYNMKVVVSNVEVEVHREVLELRSAPLGKLIHQGGKLELGDVKISYQAGELEFSGVTVSAVLIVLHLIYTDQFLDIWTDYPLGKVPPRIQKTKTAFEHLAKLVRLVDPMGRVKCEHPLIDDLRNLHGSCSVKLADGSVQVFEPLLIVRSAYFETLFSRRWGVESISLPEVSHTVFEIVLKHLYGVQYDALFDNIDKITDVSSFLNCNLDVIEVAEELMLDELSDVCQLLMKDFIALDNVYTLLRHSYHMKAYKLFGNCLWFIYNNLDVLLLDPSFGDLIDEEDNQFLNIVNDAMKWFANLKYYHRDQKPLFLQDNSGLLKEFVQDMDSFNSHWIHPLLWDVAKPIFEEPTTPSKTSVSERRRRSSARRIEEIKTTVPGAAEKPRSLSKVLYSQQLAMGSTEEVNESAIADDEVEPDFVVVSGKRRPSSKSSLSAATGTPIVRSDSVTLPQRKTSPTPVTTPRPSRPSSVTVHHESPNTSVGSLPTLSESYGATNTGTQSPSSASPVVKATSKGMPRLSQRERIKREKQPVVIPTGSSAWNTTNAWGSSAPSTPSKPYSLVSTSGPPASVPSFESILLEEKLKQEKKAPLPVRSFEDILIEEEFEMWWAQESARVQEDLQRSQQHSKPKNNRRNRKSSSSKENQRTGSGSSGKMPARKNYQRRVDV